MFVAIGEGDDEKPRNPSLERAMFRWLLAFVGTVALIIAYLATNFATAGVGNIVVAAVSYGLAYVI